MLKVSEQACPGGTASALIFIHGRLWPCDVRSGEDYNETGIFRACDFFSRVKNKQEPRARGCPVLGSASW